MYLKELSIQGFKSFNEKIVLKFPTRITGIVGPNGSGKSNVTEAFRFVLGEQSIKSMRGRKGEDLIFNGGTGTKRSSKASVSIKFDNKSGVLDAPYDTVDLTRIVNRDGSNEYLINGSQVKQSDLIEFLAKANIGASGHYVISQGEADRVLNASPEDRKEIVEDGLGLKLFQYRKNESEKKLNKVRQNIQETELLQREMAPQLRYLKKQVEKFEKANELRKELEILYLKYLSREEKYIVQVSKILQQNYDVSKRDLDDLDKQISEEKQRTENIEFVEKFKEEAENVRNELSEIRSSKDELIREVGRLEGEITVLEFKPKGDELNISKSDVENLYSEIKEKSNSSVNPIEIVKYALAGLEKLISGFSNSENKDTERREEVKSKFEQKGKELKEIESKENSLLERQNKLQKNQESEIETSKLTEKKLLTLITRKNSVEQALMENKYKLEILEEDKENFNREVTEGKVLIGPILEDHKTMKVEEDMIDEQRNIQKESRRTLERKKIELESMGTDVDSDTQKQYEDLNSRNEFLETEKADIFKSMAALNETIESLEKDIEKRFNEGIKKISKEFDEFFKVLFGGGTAKVDVVKKEVRKGDDEDGEVEIRVGIDIKVSPPRKKISALHQLSGGERALVSIAFLFAMSQVTPPPFLILDETDAALDEANSVRYGDMIEKLSKKSQLILVTHNRETMHRAGVLYGVTMNSTGISTLLSIQFEEAAKVAK